MMQKKLNKIAGHVLSINFDYSNLEYVVTAIFPSHWQYVVPNELVIVPEIGPDSIVLLIRSKNKNIDESIDFITEMVKANLKIDQHNQKLKDKLESKKRKLLQEESEIAVESKKMANTIFNEIKDRLNKEEEKGIVIPQNNAETEEEYSEEHVEERNYSKGREIDFNREDD